MILDNYTTTWMPLLIDISNYMYIRLSIYIHKQQKIKIISFTDCGLFVFSIMLFYMYMYIIPVTQFRKADWDLWKAPFLSITLLPGVPSYSGRTAFSMVVTETLVTSCLVCTKLENHKRFWTFITSITVNKKKTRGQILEHDHPFHLKKIMVKRQLKYITQVKF